MSRNLGEICEPAFAQLLPPAGFVERDNYVRLLGFKVRWRIIEGQVAVLSYPHKSYVNWRFPQSVSDIADDFRRFLFAIEQMVMCDPDFVDQPGQQIVSKTGGMIRRQSNIFIEMKKFDSLPGNVRQAGKRIQQLELGGAGRSDNPGLSFSWIARRMAPAAC